MKNILKKLGVLGLIVAVLAPFIELPKVNAAETNCAKHLQNYMFLDANFFGLNSEGKTFLEGYSSSTTAGGYLTYTVFPYAFVNNSSATTRVNWIETNNFGGNSGEVTDLDEYWSLANHKNDRNEIYAEVESSSYYAQDINIGSVFIKDTSHRGGTYVDNAIIFHGVWSSFDKDGKPTNESYDDVDYIYGEDYSLQKIFASKNKANLMSARVGTAVLTTSSRGYKFGTSAYTELGTNYFQDMIDDKWDNISVSSAYIPLSINRTINYSSSVNSTLNDFRYGFIENEGTEDEKIIVFTNATEGKKLSDVNDSYTALKAWLNAGTSSADRYEKYTINSTQDTSIKKASLDFNISKAYYWPVVLTVEYESCTTTGQWALEYDDNVDDTSVTNLPKTQTETLGKDIKISTDKPSRSGYAFRGWCESGNDKCSNPYQPGDTYKSPSSSTTIKLIAQWAEEGPGDQKKYGVMSYILGFAAVGIVAGGIYLVSKKKNLFKQI